MSKDSKNNNIEKDSNNVGFGLLFKEMKRNYFTFTTKLGAHITHLFVFSALNIKKNSLKIYKFFENKYSDKINSFLSCFVNFNKNLKNTIKKFDDYLYWLKEDFEDTRVNKGLLSSFGQFFAHMGRTIWRRKGSFVTIFNWAAPVVSFIFMLSVINCVTNLNYGVGVEYNGQKLGVIAQEGDFDKAEKALQSRINYVDGNEKITMTPKLSVQLVTNKEEIVNPNQLVDKMIVNTNAELTHATGLYIDGQFMGAVTDDKPVKDTLNNMLEKHMGEGVKSVNFQKDVEYKEGLYLSSSVKPESEILNTLNSHKTVDAYYTVVEGDTPIKIASKNDISYDKLLALNPNIENDCKIGDQVRLNVAEPFMTVEVVKEVSYSQSIPYETVKVDNSSIYKGNEKTLVKGKEGEELVTAEVTTVNGLEVGRVVKSSVVVSQPVTEQVAVGTKNPQPSKGVTITGSGQYCWPVAGGYISAYMGDSRGHKGIDIAAPAGTSIFAAESGTVIMSQTYVGYGKCIMIQHDDGNITVYGHQSQLIATKGQRVQKGELIGLVGRTGQATGNHLHFEVRRNGSYLNPLGYIK